MSRQGWDQKENFLSTIKENKYSAGKQSKDQQYSILEKFCDKWKKVQTEILKYQFPDPAWSGAGSESKHELNNMWMQQAVL